jgi:hypothetical protein
MTDSLTTAPLTAAQIRDFRCLAGLMIPASAEYNVPGADDETIFADITNTLGRDLNDVRAALTALSASAGGSFADLDPARRDAVAAAFHEGGGMAQATLSRVVLQCYYRDDRVIRSLGLEPRAPFPKGHTLEQGDWSLLDPVRSRPKMWRDAP